MQNAAGEMRLGRPWAAMCKLDLEKYRPAALATSESQARCSYRLDSSDAGIPC